jgi:lysophospholipase L1-like esterase
MIGARDELRAQLGPGFSMSAEVGRQADEFVAIVQRLRRRGHRPDVVVIQMGNNGPLYGESMEAIQKATAEVGELYLINDHAPVSWVEKSNHAIAEAAEDWPHTTLIDWKSMAESRDGLLWDDLHLTPAGATAYARLVSRAIRERFGLPPK